MVIKEDIDDWKILCRDTKFLPISEGKCRLENATSSTSTSTLHTLLSDSRVGKCISLHFLETLASSPTMRKFGKQLRTIENPPAKV